MAYNYAYMGDGLMNKTINESTGAATRPVLRASRWPTLIVVSRACFVDDGARRRFQDLDGPFIRDIAAEYRKVILLAPVFRKGRDPYYEQAKDFAFQFQVPHLAVVAVPDAGGSRRLRVLLATFWKQVRILHSVLAENRDALVLVFFPTYRAAAAALMCAWQKRPYIIYSGTMWSETIRLSPRWGGKRPWFLPLYVTVCGWLERLAFRKATVRLFFEAVRLKEYECIGPTYRVRPSCRIPILRTPLVRPLGKVVRLLCVGDLLPVKGHDTLYQALALLRKQGVDLTLTVAGAAEPAWQGHLHELANRLGVVDRIIERGWLADPQEVEKLYQEADIFVLASRSEGFPRVLYEAMGQALPVVTTDIPNIGLTLRHETNALLVPPDDVQALAAAITRLVNDDELRRRIGSAAWRWAQEQSGETDTEQFSRIVRSVYERGDA